MKPSHALRHTSKILLLLTLLFVTPMIMSAQSKKKDNPPPQQQQQSSPPARPAPAPPPQQRQPQQQPQQQQPQRTTSPGAVNPGRGAGAATGNNAGRATGGSGSGAGSGNNTGKGAVAGNTATGVGNTGAGTRAGNSGAGTTAPKPLVTPKVPVKLAPAESQKQIQNLNTSRAAMTGVNRNPLPQGQVVMKPNGAKTIVASGGRQIDLRPDGTVHRVSLSNGSTATFRPNGTISSVRATGIQIDHNSNGSRTVVSERNGQRIVSTGAGQGYLQRTYVERNGNTYVQRTYVVNNTTYVSVYRSYSYRNVTYYNYVPVYYYRPVFYGWVYDPWAAPVYYRWGWYGDPWYGPYGYYFAPYPVYPSAAYWMTDYIIAENLRAAYEAGAADTTARNESYAQQQTQSDSVTLSPAVKEMIAQEVKAQLAAEREAAAQNANSSNPPSASPTPSAGNSEPIPPALDPNVRVFIVTNRLDVNAGGQECSLSPGDVLTRSEDKADDANTVGVSVVSSQKADCRMGSTPRIQVADLQEMHNQFREKMDNGLKTLADKQGKAGLPSAPSVRTVAGEVPPPTADSSAAKRLKTQQQDADQTEKDIQQQAFTEKSS